MAADEGLVSDAALVVLDAEGVTEACRQTHPEWHQGRDFEAYAARVREALDRMGPAMRYVGLHDARGRLVASARELSSELLWQGDRVPAMGIAAVFVRPDLRGRGIGRRLVRALTGDARARGFRAAFLFSDIGPGYYVPHGFRACPAQDFCADVADLAQDTSLAVRRACPDDLGMMLRWYHQSAACSPLTVWRTATWWRYFRWWREAEGDHVLCNGSADVGYLNVRLQGSCLYVYDWAAPGIDPSRVWGAVRARATDLGAKTVAGWLVPTRRQEWMKPLERSGALPMVGPLDDALVLPDLRAAAFEELDHF